MKDKLSSLWQRLNENKTSITVGEAALLFIVFAVFFLVTYLIIN